MVRIFKIEWFFVEMGHVELYLSRTEIESDSESCDSEGTERNSDDDENRT